MPELLAHVALAAVTALAWLGAGALLLRPARGAVGDRLLEGLNEVGAGAIAFALLTFFAGLAGFLYAVPFIVVTAAAAVLGAVRAAGLWAWLCGFARLARWQLGSWSSSASMSSSR